MLNDSALAAYAVPRLNQCLAGPDRDARNSSRPMSKTPESEAIKTRILTLNEYDNEVAEPILMLLNATYWHHAGD